MHGTRILMFAFAVLAPAALACGDDDDPGGPATSFSAQLAGDEEVPPVVTTATGSAEFTLENNELTYTITVNNLLNPVLGHIHLAATGVNGPVRLNLCGTGAPEPDCAAGTVNGVLATGTNGTTVGTPPITFDELLTAMRTGNAYVNVHTNSTGCTLGQPGCNPGGEIRGQIETN